MLLPLCALILRLLWLWRATASPSAMSSEQLAAQVAAMKAVLVSLEAQLQQRTAEAHLLSAALASLVAEQKQEREVTAEVIAEVAALECQKRDWTVLRDRREAATSAELQGTASVASEKVRAPCKQHLDMPISGASKQQRSCCAQRHQCNTTHLTSAGSIRQYAPQAAPRYSLF